MARKAKPNEPREVRNCMDLKVGDRVLTDTGYVVAIQSITAAPMRCAWFVDFEGGGSALVDETDEVEVAPK